MRGEDLTVPILDDLRVTYDGPVTLAEDLMVFNVTEARITQRMAVVPDLAWPVPSDRSVADRPAIDPDKLVQLSPELRAAEIPVDGVDTTVRSDEAK